MRFGIIPGLPESKEADQIMAKFLDTHLGKQDFSSRQSQE